MAKYGGFLSPLIRGIAQTLVRETMVQAGLKKPHRGGIKITQTKKFVYGKDKYGRDRHPKKKGRK